MNNRTHRKILVVDGTDRLHRRRRASPTSGPATRRTRKHWRDTHFRVEGPAVAQMQAAFMENWIEVTGTVLHGADYFPGAARRRAAQLAQFFISSPGGGGESMQLMYLLSIAAAGKTIRLSAVVLRARRHRGAHARRGG